MNSLILAGIGILLFALIFASTRRARRRQRARQFMQDLSIPAWTGYETIQTQQMIRVNEIASNAHLILLTRYQGYSGSRRQMASQFGMPERQWRPAHRLLKNLHITHPKTGIPQIPERRAERMILQWGRSKHSEIASAPNYVLPH